MFMVCLWSYLVLLCPAIMRRTQFCYSMRSLLGFSEVMKFSGISIMKSFLMMVPWMLTLIDQVTRVNEGFWIQPVTFDNVFHYLAYVFTVSYKFKIQVLAIFILIALSIVALKYFSENNDDENVHKLIESSTRILIRKFILLPVKNRQAMKTIKK